MSPNNSNNQFILQDKFFGNNKITLLKVKSWNDIGLVHGFTTRISGFSKPPYNSLNLGHSVGDDLLDVENNWTLLADCVNISRDNFVSIKQVHGNKVLEVNNPQALTLLKQNQQEADAITTNLPDCAVAVKIADCVPMLAINKKLKLSGAIHAGWRGTVLEIAKKSIDTFKNNYNSKADDLEVAIGPCIGECCFEVDSTTANNFATDCVIKKGDKIFVDLKKANYLQLVKSGIKPENIYVSELCTYCNNELFYSHRRDDGKTGRMAAFACWQAP